MFHLLVRAGGWPKDGGSISTQRIYIGKERPEESIFLSDNGNLKLNEIIKIPTLLVSETGGNGVQLANVAHITNVRQENKDTYIQYIIDTTINPISNADLELLLNVGGFGLTHTCWTIREDDLYKILLKNQQKLKFSPTAFNIDNEVVNENLVSVMMPFSAEFDSIYKAINNAVIAENLICSRADNFWENDVVIQDVVSLIARAKVVICDCSNRNPNVFYEIGIAHTLGKDVVLITQNDNDVPFDLKHRRYIKYQTNNEGLTTLTQDIRGRIKTLIKKR